MEQIDYTPLLPKLPTEDVVSFAKEQGAFRQEYLIYCSGRAYEPLEARTKDAVLVNCTRCGDSFYADKIYPGECVRYALAPFGWKHPETGEDVTSGNDTHCPCCGSAAKTVHISNMRVYGNELVDDAWVSQLMRIPVEGKRDRLALLDWCVRRCIDKSGGERWEIWPYTAWIVEEKKIVRIMGHARNIGGAISLFGEWRQRKTFRDDYGKIDRLMPWDPAILEGTTAENCKLDLYINAKGKRLVRYLALWRKRPAVENLMVQGCGHLVRTWISKESESDYQNCGGIPKLPAVNWKEKRPARMLGLNKEEFRRLHEENWSAYDLERYHLTRKAGLTARRPEDIELLRSLPVYDINRILEEGEHRDFWRILRYLRRQEERWSTLWDYWALAAADGRDLADNLVRYPRNLHAAHQKQIEDRQAAQQRMIEYRRAAKEREWRKKRAKEIEARKPIFERRAAELGRYSFELNGLLIRPCANEDELLDEGRILHHCVATYAQMHARGSTAIFFIRQTDAPDKPFFTLEFDEKRLEVRQNRGLRNCARTPEVEAFETAWLEYVRRVCGKKRTA